MKWLVILMLLTLVVIGTLGARIRRDDDDDDDDDDSEEEYDMYTSEEYEDAEYEDAPVEPCSHDSSFNEVMGTQPHNPDLALPVGSITKFPTDAGSDVEDARIDRPGWVTVIPDRGPNPYIEIDFTKENRGPALISQLITNANAYVELEYKAEGSDRFVSMRGQRFEDDVTFNPRVTAEKIRVTLGETFLPTATEYNLRVGAYACFPNDPHEDVSQEDDEDDDKK